MMVPTLLRHLGLCLLPFLVACGGETPPNLVLVIGDTLRADRLGTYGNTRGLTPYLDELAKGAVVFENASNHAPWTLPSTASLLTSLHPKEHGAGGVVPRFTKLSDQVTTLTEVLRDRGYRTHAVVNVTFLTEGYGLTQGFESVDAEAPKDNIQMRMAQVTTDDALRWLDREDLEEPFFLLVHYFDPHAVYAPPQPFRKRFAAPRDQGNEEFVFGTREHMVKLRAGQLDVGEGIIRRAEKLYDGEVAYLDAELGRLFDQLDSRGLSERTVLAFTADHGEEFLEHGGFEHGHTLYPELTHVPLLIRAPGLNPGRVPQSVGHIDVAPTLCQLLNIGAPGSFVGKSLVDLVGNPNAEGHPILAHGNFWSEPLTSWRSGEWQLIINADGRSELYRWQEDPGCRTNLAAQDPQRVAELKEELDAVQKQLRRMNGAKVELSAEELERLRGLGYAEGEEEDPEGDEEAGGDEETDDEDEGK